MPDSPEEAIARHAEPVRPIVRAVRAVVISAMPGVCEFVYHGVLSYGPTGAGFDRVCYIAPQPKGYVNLGFFFGSHLPDPRRLLVGEGARMRHVKIRSVDDASDPAIHDLVRAAWDDAPASVAALHARRRPRR